ncbi:Rap1a/Tai family immunity protein [Neptuniibacter halophilus]|uniref:Rap1a/Tai family immunity protein n=1 Tax=Neptuniibacter halophilus TaxID=651666 RepID=UPI0025735319|nr:Rap1a/Tai family immunity protein [Neptuniibacter halophilus]
MKKIIPGMLISAWIISQTASAALLQVHEEQLLSSCQALKQRPAAVEAAACATYINGFIDGALLTDSENATELQSADQEDFMSRALRTRLGGREGEGHFLHFCVPAERARAEIIQQIAPHIAGGNAGVSQLKASIYEGLKAELPCPVVK